MGTVVQFPQRLHARASSTKKSGRIFSFGIPVSLSIWKTRTKGTPRSTQRVTVDLFTAHLRAKSECRSPLSARSMVSDFAITNDSCTTNNRSQGVSLHKGLTTQGEEVGILATMPKTLPKRLPEPPVRIYGGRQPARPHYLGALLKLHNVARAKLIEDLGVDKSLVSRWLDDDKPTSPGIEWKTKLGWYFAPSLDPDDFVDIFADPSVSRFQRATKGLSDDQIDQWLSSLEAAASIRKKTGTKS